MKTNSPGIGSDPFQRRRHPIIHGLGAESEVVAPAPVVEQPSPSPPVTTTTASPAPPAEETVKTTVIIRADLHQKMRLEVAVHRDRSYSSILNELLEARYRE